MRHRLFAAIRPPPPVANALLAIENGVAGARWQNKGQLHLTLRFFGELEAAAAEDLATMLESVRGSPFTLVLKGVGHFERKGRTHALWAGLAPSAPLAALQREIERAARRAGLPPETRNFLPHVTLARLNTASGPVLPFLAAQGTLSGEPWPVEAFDLVESRLQPEGAAYETVRRYRLG